MKLKRILLLVAIGVIAIWGLAFVILLVTGSVKITVNDGAIDDSSTVSNNGPYVLYDNNEATTYYYKNNKVIASKRSVNRMQDTLEVLNANLKDAFHVKKKEKIQHEADQYNSPDKCLVISDIEGNFFALKKILIENEVIDSLYNWTYGNNHLVIVGDLVDRGLAVTECLWLVYKLEEQALKSGGKVHYILGNHEAMIMSGNTRYVRNKYKELSKAFQLDYSQDMFGQNSEFGRWMRSKNIVEKIGYDLFVHGGISMDIVEAQLNISRINDIARKNYGKDKSRYKEDLNAALINEKKGPLWYRGYTEGKLDQEDVNKILRYFNCDHIIFGHSIVDQATSYYQNRMIGIDILQPQNQSHGPTKALLIDATGYYEVSNGLKSRTIIKR